MSSSSSSSTSTTSSSELSVEQIQQLHSCLFMPDLTKDDIQRWYDQGFALSGNYGIPYGLR